MVKNELKINGTQNFMGVDIPVVEGGFGENCRVVTAKTMARTILEMYYIKLSQMRNQK